MTELKIGGFLKTTLLDYPGRMASTVFLTGCNMRCPFCHNRDLVMGEGEEIRKEDVLSHLRKRSRVLDGVCITGGEPTLWGSALADFIRRIKTETSLLVKLDTNGTNPALLSSLTAEGLIDYVAMDIKSALNDGDYAHAAGRAVDLGAIRESISLLKASGLEYEFRTTLVKGIHTKEKIIEAASSLEGAPIYYLQGFVDSGNLISGLGLSAFTREETEDIASETSRFIKTELRGL